MEKVSICTPVFNVQNYIEKSARSLFSQTYSNIEYIFVDDCSEDKSIEILKRVIDDYPERKNMIHILKHEHNKGLASARNTGYENATGDFIFHMDSDDYLDKDAIELFVNKAIEENADMVICNFRLEYEKYSLKQDHLYSKNKNEYISLLLNRRSILSIVARLIKKSVLDNMDVLSVDNVNVGEDYATTPRICYYCNKIVKIDREMYHYVRTNTGSYTHTVSRKNIDEMLMANKILEDFFKDKIDLNTIIQSKLNNKINILYMADYKDFAYVCETYDDLPIYSVKIPIFKKVILIMSKNKMYRLLYVCIYLIKLIRKFK